MAKRCAFINADGNSCGGYAVSDDIYCFSHSPKYKDQKIEASKRGGMSSRRDCIKLDPVSIGAPRDILMLLTETINLVRSSSITTATANSIGFLANSFCKILELSDIEERLTALEAKSKH